ncbi:MAG: hypothetical protein ACRD8O_13365 [Bryobacteraceae bacterium]
MFRRIVLTLMVAGLFVATAAAKSYSVTLFQPAQVGATELKAGDYRVELKDSKAVITNGKQSVEVEVKVETTQEKFNSTSVRFQNGDGKYKIQEIRLGGTKTRLVFN